MAEKVGTIHQHVLPSAYEVKLHEVYACHCGKEFYRGLSEDYKNPSWGPVDDSGLPVLYDKTVDGKEFIGRADKDTVFDEEVVDGGEEVSEADSGGAVPEGAGDDSTGESSTGATE